MKKKWEVRYLVTAVASIPVYKAYGKTETYRQAAKDGSPAGSNVLFPLLPFRPVLLNMRKTSPAGR